VGHAGVQGLGVQGLGVQGLETGDAMTNLAPHARH